MNQDFMPVTFQVPGALMGFRRTACSRELLIRNLTALGGGAAEEVGRHADFLVGRIQNIPSFEACAVVAGVSAREALCFEDVIRVYPLPTYLHEYYGGNFRWTVNSFNPHNAECGLSGWNDQTVYLQLLIDEQDFYRHVSQRDLTEADFKLFSELQMSVIHMLRQVWISCEPITVLGCGGAELRLLSRLHRSSSPAEKPSFSELYWPIMFLSPEERAELVWDREFLADYATDYRHPWRRLFEEELPCGGLLLYSLENCPEDEEVYSSAVGRLALFSDFAEFSCGDD